MPGADRVLDFSLGQAHLSMRYEQLVIRRKDAPDTSVPMAETAVVVLASREVTCSQAALDGLMRHGAAVVVCDSAMLPTGMMLPLAANSLQTQRIIAQIAAPLPLRKRLWQQVVQRKILAQAQALQATHEDDGGLPDLVARVRSGDPTNVESTAAQRYWQCLFRDPDFRRRRDADDQNRLLNYGYAVIRAAVARALCAAGLHPSVGLHHHGRGNPFCLADDLMEPFRPLIDAAVHRVVAHWGKDVPLTRDVKSTLVGVLHQRLVSHDEHRTVNEWITRSASSLARIVCREPDAEKRLFFPASMVPR